MLITFGAFISEKSLSERELSLHEYAQLTQANFFGLGPGAYSHSLYSNLISWNTWSIQPVHNTFLYVYYDLGLIGLFYFVYFLIIIMMFHVEHSKIKLQNNVPRGTWEEKGSTEYLSVPISRKRLGTEKRWPHLGVMLFILAFSLSDHFFYTIPQGQIILWISIIAALASKIIDKN
jgi:hypothetical protein